MRSPLAPRPLLVALLLAAPGTAAGQGANVDLSLGNAVLSPRMATAGSTITVSGTIVAAPTFTGNVTLEFSAAFGSATNLGRPQVFVNGATTNFNVQFVVPNGTSPGFYPVTLIADPQNVIAETNEANNSIGATPVLEIVSADLQAVTLTGNPVATGGQPYAIQSTIANLGQADANGFIYAYYLGRRPSGPPLLTVGPSNLAQGASFTGMDTLTLPATPGPVTISLWVNADLRVSETNLNNNIRTLDISVRIPQPDLIGSLSSFSGTAEIGQQVTLSARIQNQGDEVSPAAEYAYMLSVDPTIDNTDRVIFRSALTTSVAVNAVEAMQDTFRIPRDTPPSIYYLGVMADPNNLVPESNEGNNAALGQMITIFEPELLITTLELPDATQGEAYATRLEHRGGAFDPMWSITQGSLPPGISLDPRTATLSGRPTQRGTFTFTVRATAGNAQSDAEFVLTVLPGGAPPEIVTTTLPGAIVGQQYASQLVAINGAEPLRWSSPNPPSWLNVTPEGALEGLPTVAGTDQFEVVVTDAAGNEDRVTLELVAVDAANTVRVQAEFLPEAVVDTDYCDPTAFVFQATGGTPPYAWSAVGELPPGFTLDAQGTFCGTATELGTFDFVVRVQDATGGFDTGGFRLDVVAGGEDLIRTSSLPNATINVLYATQIEASGTAPIEFTITTGALPPGLTMSTAGEISGTPDTAGTFAFVVSAIDGVGRTGIAPLSIRVVEPITGGLDSGGSGCRCLDDRPAAGGLAWLFLCGLALRRRRLRSAS